jgi:hypothetical protein
VYVRNAFCTLCCPQPPLTRLTHWLQWYCSQIVYALSCRLELCVIRGQLKCDGKRAETRFCLSAKRTSLFKSAGASVQSTNGSRGLRSSGSYAGYTMFRGTHSIRQYPLHFPPPPGASACAITFQMESTTYYKSTTTFFSFI